MYVLDTNALSELDKPRPDQAYVAWFGRTPVELMYASCITFGELQKGVELLPDGARRQGVEKRTGEIIEAFNGRILDIDIDTALDWARLVAAAQKAGRTAPAIDSLIAAQCLSRGMTLVTRNAKDFEQFAGLQVFSPWS